MPKRIQIMTNLRYWLIMGLAQNLALALWWEGNTDNSLYVWFCFPMFRHTWISYRPESSKSQIFLGLVCCTFPKLIALAVLPENEQSFLRQPFPTTTCQSTTYAWWMKGAICCGSCPYHSNWIGKPMANFKKSKANTFWDLCPFDGFCGRFDRFPPQAVLRQFMRFDKKKLCHSGMWFHTQHEAWNLQ